MIFYEKRDFIELWQGSVSVFHWEEEATPKKIPSGAVALGWVRYRLDDRFFHLIISPIAGILMASDALTDMVAAMRSDVALVTQIPFCADREGFGPAVEQVN